MKKSLFLSTVLASALFSAQLQWGYGTIDLKGGFIGLDKTISDDINTYTLTEQHSNIFDSNFFYGYTFTIFDSKKIRQLRRDINSGISTVNSAIKNVNGSITIPNLDYTLRGFDGGITIGYDLINNDNKDYLGVGLYGGISVPYINSTKSVSDTIKVNIKMADYFKDSKTDITTYKIGLGIFGQKSLSKNFALYGNAIYAYQNGNLKNKYANIDLDIDGSYIELNTGLKFSAPKESFAPGLYATIGWRYRNWKINDVSLNISGIAGLSSPKSDMEFTTNALTVGVGYSF